MKCNTFNLSMDTDPCSNVKVGFYWSFTAFYNNGGIGVDISDDTFEMTIKDALGGSLLLTMPEVLDNETTGLYIPTPTDGKIYIQITEADTVIIGAGTFPYEMTRTDVDGLKTIFMQGTIQFTNRGY